VIAPDPEEYVELVLSVVEEIPWGRVTSYGAIAGVVGGGPRRGDAAAALGRRRHGGGVLGPGSARAAHAGGRLTVLHSWRFPEITAEAVYGAVHNFGQLVENPGAPVDEPVKPEECLPNLLRRRFRKE
jgi:hypothetical protein